MTWPMRGMQARDRSTYRSLQTSYSASFAAACFGFRFGIALFLAFFTIAVDLELMVDGMEVKLLFKNRFQRFRGRLRIPILCRSRGR